MQHRDEVGDDDVNHAVLWLSIGVEAGAYRTVAQGRRR